MKEAISYLNSILGVNTRIMDIQKDELNKLPMYLNQAFQLGRIYLFNKAIILIEPKYNEEYSISQIEKQTQQLESIFKEPVLIVLHNLQAYNRKRLIEKKINFIVDNKQLFLPALLMDFRESYNSPLKSKKTNALLPSAQFIVIYYLLHKKWEIENFSFKEIAKQLDYTAMAITNAVENLKSYELITIKGEKEKFIKFEYDRHELWNRIQHQKLFINPVIKKVFVDEKVRGKFILKSNESALPEYTNMTPSNQQYYAIEKNIYYSLHKNNELINENEYEGKYCIEIWKYNPLKLVDELYNDESVVDPLSLYLSLLDVQNERVEMALEQLIEKQIW
jgi:hypothetical protein